MIYRVDPYYAEWLLNMQKLNPWWCKKIHIKKPRNGVNASKSDRVALWWWKLINSRVE
jgi:hypothetical protein